jgi:hypothetical protein
MLLDLPLHFLLTAALSRVFHRVLSTSGCVVMFLLPPAVLVEAPPLPTAQPVADVAADTEDAADDSGAIPETTPPEPVVLPVLHPESPPLACGSPAEMLVSWVGDVLRSKLAAHVAEVRPPTGTVLCVLEGSRDGWSWGG